MGIGKSEGERWVGGLGARSREHRQVLILGSISESRHTSQAGFRVLIFSSNLCFVCG